MKLRLVLFTIGFLAPCLVSAQRQGKHSIYAGGLGGIATLSGDGSAVITSSTASTSLFDPQNGVAAEIFAGIHIFEYVSLQTDYIHNRNVAVLASTSGEPSSLNFLRQPETITQSAFLGNVLVYFRRRGSRIRRGGRKSGG